MAHHFPEKNGRNGMGPISLQSVWSSPTAAFKIQIESQLMAVSISKARFDEGFSSRPVLARWACGEVMCSWWWVAVNSSEGLVQEWHGQRCGHAHQHGKRRGGGGVAIGLTPTPQVMHAPSRDRWFLLPKTVLLCPFPANSLPTPHITTLLISISIGWFPTWAFKLPSNRA